MNNRVMKSAQENQIIEVGISTVGPMHNVMRNAPRCGASATRECTTTIASDQRHILRGSDGAVLATHFEYSAHRVHNDTLDAGEARDPAHRRR